MSIKITTFFYGKSATRRLDGSVPALDLTDKPFHFTVEDDDKELILGSFSVDDYPDADQARAAAELCKAHYEADPWVSPFLRHRPLLLAGGSSTAERLASLTLAFWNGQAYPFNASGLRNFDKKHFEIAIELIRSYHQLGESDKHFMSLCNEILEMRLRREEIRLRRDATEAAED